MSPEKKLSSFIEELIGFSFKKHPCNKKIDKEIRMSLFMLLKVKKTLLKRRVLLLLNLES